MIFLRLDIQQLKFIHRCSLDFGLDCLLIVDDCLAAEEFLYFHKGVIWLYTC